MGVKARPAPCSYPLTFFLVCVFLDEAVVVGVEEGARFFSSSAEV